MIVDAEWVFTMLDAHMPFNPAVWDVSGVDAAIARHGTEPAWLHSGKPDVAWRAAALLHTLTVCPPLASPMNEYLALAVTDSYLRMARADRPVPLARLADLVESARQEGDVFSIAEAIRAETV